MTLTITLIGIGVAVAITIAVINVLNPITFSPNFSGSTGESAREQATEATPQTTSSPTSWGGVVIGLILSVLLIGALFFWAPWGDNKNDTPHNLSFFWESAVGPHGEQGVRIFVGDLAPTSICFDSLTYVRQKGEKKDYPPTHCIKWNGGGSSFWIKPVELPKDKFVVAHTQ